MSAAQRLSRLSATEEESRLKASRAEAETLKERIEELKMRLNNGSLSGVQPPGKPFPRKLEIQRVLEDHCGKVYALDWGRKWSSLLSASQDGRMIVWDLEVPRCEASIELHSAWVMACAFEPERNEHIASGGLDNLCSIYHKGEDGEWGFAMELAHHDGYLSTCRFVGGNTVLTGSGDSTCVLWDMEAADARQVFVEHAGDVMSLDVNPMNPYVFVSGSSDATAKVWDTRSGACVQTYVGHESDINAVRFMRNGRAFATGSDDSTCKLFDLRSYARLNEFAAKDFVSGVSSIDFSHSGRVLFGGYDDFRVYMWDSLVENAEMPQHMLQHHENHVSCIGVNVDGSGLASGSWDGKLAVWR